MGNLSQNSSLARSGGAMPIYDLRLLRVEGGDRLTPLDRALATTAVSLGLQQPLATELSLQEPSVMPHL
jgi:hypothetical protein